MITDNQKDTTTGFSIIVPLYNEEENIRILHKELISTLRGYKYELIYINDGSTDSTYSAIKQEIEKIGSPCAKIINLSNNLGQSLAFKLGLDNARFPIVVFMDGDLQNDPKDIPRLIEKLKEGYDLVQGIRVKRRDSYFKKVVPSVIANCILRLLCGSKFKDIGCSLKAFKKDVAIDMPFQQGTHRVLPVYFCLKRAKVTEMIVNHRKRIYGKTKYGFSRSFEVLLEVVKINYLEKNSNRFLFLSVFLALLILLYGITKSITKFSFNPEQAILYIFLSILGFYIFVISAILYISRSLYMYNKNISKLEDVKIETYG